MVRYSILAAIVASLVVLAFRRWYWGLCGLVLLTVLVQHPSMPSNIAGLQGLNAWNIVFVCVVASWAMNRRHEAPARSIPDGLVWLLIGFVLMIIAAGLVASFDLASFATHANVSWVMVDGIVNPLKYLAIGVLFCDGARTRERIFGGLFAAVGSCFLYAMLMLKALHVRLAEIDFADARRLTDKLVGLYANDLGEVLAFAFWAGLLLLPLLRRGWPQWLWVLAIAVTMPPFVSLKSRAGFLAFAVVGLLVGVFRWRQILVILPIAAITLAALAPTVAERVMTGVEPHEQVDWNAVSAGRLTNLWPPVIRQIGKSPVIGHGRYAILREDCRDEILYLEGVVPSHPHNAYLEVLLDVGVLGAMLVAAWLVTIFATGIRLFRSADPLARATGSVALTGLFAELCAGVAGSSFFPMQSSVPYLCVWGMAFRLCAQTAAAPRWTIEQRFHSNRALAPATA